MAANLSADMQNIDRVVVLIEEVRCGIAIGTPVSMTATIVLRQRRCRGVWLRCGAGVGRPVAAIMEARKQQPFMDLDFVIALIAKKPISEH